MIILFDGLFVPLIYLSIVVNKTNRYENSYGINGYKLKLREDLGRGEFSFKDIFVIDINNRDDLYTFA